MKFTALNLVTFTLSFRQGSEGWEAKVVRDGKARLVAQHLTSKVVFAADYFFPNSKPK